MDEPQANPVLVDVTRGGCVESRHRGAAVVMDPAGGVVAAWGDVERPVYPRSAVKPLQALALIETGAADKFSLGDAEIALAAASHSGAPEHVSLVTAWLERMGLGAGDLECGPHAPIDEEAAAALDRAGEEPSPVHNNCSGKHTGFLATALHLGEETRGYVEPGHPVQRRLVEVLSDLGSVDLEDAPRGTDGCGIPVIAMPLRAMALGMARLANPDGLPPARAAACRRVTTAMAAHGRLVAGRGRFVTRALEAASGAFVVKSGAEGVYVAAMDGYGVALKIDDGANRASETAMAAILDHLGVLDGIRDLDSYLDGVILNRPGARVGAVRPAPGWLG
jgi:L-asparaginase II